MKKSSRLELHVVGKRNKLIKYAKSLSATYKFNSYDDVSTLLKVDLSEECVILISSEKITRKAISRIKRQLTSVGIIILTSESEERTIVSDELSAVSYITENMSSEAMIYNIESVRASVKRQKRVHALQALMYAQSNPKCDTLGIISESTKAATLPNTPSELALSLANMLKKLGASETILISRNEAAQLISYHSIAGSETVTVDYQSNFTIKEVIHRIEGVQEVSSDTNNLDISMITSSPWSKGLLFYFEIEIPHSQKFKEFYVLALKSDLEGFDELQVRLARVLHSVIKLGLEKSSILDYNQNAAKDWSTTFDSISEPLSIINKRFELVRTNRAFAQSVGKKQNTVEGKHCYSLFAQRRSKCANCPTSNLTTHSVPKKVIGRRDQRYYVWSYPIKSKGAEFQRIQFYRNISVEQQLASTLIQSERMKAIGDLLTAVSHEINNPLTSIISTAQVALAEQLRKVQPNEELIDDLKEIESSASRAIAIIDNLLGFGDNSSGATCSVEDAISSAIRFSKSSLRSVKVELDLDEHLRKISIEKSSFQQILLNIITNSANAMKSSGLLKIFGEVSTEFFEIRLEDNGIGMSKETMKQIFEPFFTQRNNGQGTGLGMVIVKDLVNKLRGDISVRSLKNVGTTVKLKFPLPTVSI